MAPIELTAGQHDAIAELIAFLRTVPKHSQSAARSLRQAQSERRRDEFNGMVDTYGLDRARELLFPKLRGTPEFPSDATSGRGVLQPYDNDLAYHCQLVRAAIEQYRDEAITPPPYYARRIAIILRKAKAYQLEASFLAQCVKFYGDPAFAERRAKALALAAKRRE